METLSGDRHQFGNAGEVPVGITYLGMTDIGRERQDRSIEIDALLVEAQGAVHDERTPQLVQTVMGVVATGSPAERFAQRLQGVKHPGLICGLTVIAQEKSVIPRVSDLPITQLGLCSQAYRYARVHWHQPLSVEFSFADPQDAGNEINVVACESKRFRNSKPTGGQQSEDTAASRGR